VSLVRPVRKLNDPDGNAWELYVLRAKRGGAPARLELFSMRTFLWTTTADHVARVLNQIAAGLESGELARPLGAVYRGRA
jgi:hypothetical protein